MASLQAPLEPPPIQGVRRSLHEARGVQFHVTEAGLEDGAPVVALHGWPQHHYCYRDLLADPPAGVRLIAPDLPGYGWSGPPPHRWAKEDVASDLLALLDELGLGRVLLVGHDWGGWIGHLMILREPDRFSGFLALAIPHVWNTPRTTLPHIWRLGHMPLNATVGTGLCTRTSYIEKLVFRLGVGKRAAFTPEDVRWFADRFRDPVCARATVDTYRTFVLRELPARSREPERRRAPVPIRALLGTKDFAIHRSLMAPETALADDYTLELIPGAGHFLAEEAPDTVRERLVGLISPN
jgi:pimeloyl-ACP methyl ester carboxylesterase